MSEKENRQELLSRLIRARDKEEVRAILGPETAQEEIDRAWQEIEAHRPAGSLDGVDDDELDAVSGGADRDWDKDGCSASVEKGSWCMSDDQCAWLDVTYSNFDLCLEGKKHDWRYISTEKELYFTGTAKYRRFVCRKCRKEKREYV